MSKTPPPSKRGRDVEDDEESRAAKESTFEERWAKRYNADQNPPPDILAKQPCHLDTLCPGRWIYETVKKNFNTRTNQFEDEWAIKLCKIFYQRDKNNTIQFNESNGRAHVREAGNDAMSLNLIEMKRAVKYMLQKLKENDVPMREIMDEDITTL